MKLLEIEAAMDALGRPIMELGAIARGGPKAMLAHKQAVADWEAANPEKVAEYARLSKLQWEAEAEWRRQEEAAATMRWVEKQLEASGMGERARAAAANPKPSEALEAVKAWLTSGKCWLVLLGGTGTGKTTAAAWALGEVIRQKETADARTASRLARMSGFDEGARELERLSNVSLLVVDDIGAEMQTAWGQGLLSELLDNRHQGFKKTILTSNLSQDAFKQRIGERMVDRIAEDGKAVMLGGKSLRRA